MAVDKSPEPAVATRPNRRWLQVATGVLGLFGLLAAAFLSGPRNTFGPNAPAQRALPPPDIGALDDWLETSEAAYGDVRPGTAKGIVWHAGARQRTPWSVVYVHGFSASRLETAPLAERVAEQLGANVFYARLSGHGRSGAAMAEATAQDWMADAIEAVSIGQILGERVLLMSCSTGSTLATWLALTPDAANVAAQVFLSPNFGPRDKRSEIINYPWGKQIVLALQGENRSWTPSDAREANAWTWQYPTRAVFPVLAIVKQVRESDLSGFRTPVLVLYSEQDQTVDPVQTRAAFARIGAVHKTIEVVDYSNSIGQHVLAGDILAPQATAPMAARIVSWTRGLP